MTRDDDTRDDRGRWETRHDDQDYIDAVAQHQPAGTRDVADELRITVENARLRLKDLVRQGELDSKDVSGRLVFSIRQ